MKKWCIILSYSYTVRLRTNLGRSTEQFLFLFCVVSETLIFLSKLRNRIAQELRIYKQCLASHFSTYIYILYFYRYFHFCISVTQRYS